MGINNQGDFSPLHNESNENSLTFKADSPSIELPDSAYIRDGDMMRDGMDLVLEGPAGQVTVEGYFAAETSPMLTTVDGSSYSPEMVNSFVKSSPEYAKFASTTDESPVGSVEEFSGDATITRTDGSVENVQLGTPVFEGDIIETGSDGAVNITFSDDTNFAVSQDAKLAIDEYVYDPMTESGSQDFSVLKGVFVFTSGLIGRDDPDDVHIQTPQGSIGIRGTIIAGDVNNGEITVVEGAIVLTDFDGNEVTLANQFETAQFKPGQGIEHQGQKTAAEVGEKFVSVSKVSPSLFSSINDAAAEAIDAEGSANDDVQVEEMIDGQADAEGSVEGEAEAQANPDGSVDQNADNQVDGTVDDSDTTEAADEAGEGEAGSDDGKPALAGEAEQSNLDAEPVAEQAPEALAEVAPELAAWGKDFAQGVAEHQAEIASLSEARAQAEDNITTQINQTNEADTIVDLADNSDTSTTEVTFDPRTQPMEEGVSDDGIVSLSDVAEGDSFAVDMARFIGRDLNNRTIEDVMGDHDTLTALGEANRIVENVTLRTFGGEDEVALGSVTGSEVFLGLGDDTLRIETPDDGDNSPDDTDAPAASFNTVHGGAGNDTFEINAPGSNNNILNGDEGNDTFELQLNGNTVLADKINGGDGHDTLKLEGNGTLDLRDVMADRFKAFEELDLNDFDADMTNDIQTVKFSLPGLLEALTNPVTNVINSLRIRGNSNGEGDTLDFASDLSQLGLDDSNVASKSISGGVTTFMDSGGNTIATRHVDNVSGNIYFLDDGGDVLGGFQKDGTQSTPEAGANGQKYEYWQDTDGDGSFDASVDTSVTLFVDQTFDTTGGGII